MLLGWGARDDVESLNHTAYLLHSTRCPEASGYESPASSRFSSPSTRSLPRERTPWSRVLPGCQVTHCRKQLHARKLGGFQLSPAWPEELPNVSAYKSSAERLRLQVSQRTGFVSSHCSKPLFFLPAGCCLNKLLQRMKLTVLQVCIILCSGV